MPIEQPHRIKYAYDHHVARRRARRCQKRPAISFFLSLTGNRRHEGVLDGLALAPHFVIRQVRERQVPHVNAQRYRDLFTLRLCFIWLCSQKAETVQGTDEYCGMHRVDDNLHRRHRPRLHATSCTAQNRGPTDSFRAHDIQLHVKNIGVRLAMMRTRRGKKSRWGPQQSTIDTPNRQSHGPMLTSMLAKHEVGTCSVRRIMPCSGRARKTRKANRVKGTKWKAISPHQLCY